MPNSSCSARRGCGQSCGTDSNCLAGEGKLTALRQPQQPLCLVKMDSMHRGRGGGKTWLECTSRMKLPTGHASATASSPHLLPLPPAKYSLDSGPGPLHPFPHVARG